MYEAASELIEQTIASLQAEVQENKVVSAEGTINKVPSARRGGTITGSNNAEIARELFYQLAEQIVGRK